MAGSYGEVAQRAGEGACISERLAREDGQEREEPRQILFPDVESNEGDVACDEA